MQKEIDGGYVQVEIHKKIATIEFYHEQGNSLPSKILEALANQISGTATNNDVAVIILRSKSDKIFCSGASFSELLNIKNEQEGFAFFSGFAKVINAMRKSPKLIIARVQGKCVGGGVGLAAAADYAIATNAADIKLSELAVGIGPFVVGPAVERKIGASAFGQLAIDATKWRNADWAKRKGLFAETHETVEGMDESISNLASTLASSSLPAMQELKKVLWQNTTHWDELLFDRAKISGKLILSAESKAAIEKFKTKGK
jgi:methylglutaconyl-CoA hydratase